MANTLLLDGRPRRGRRRRRHWELVFDTCWLLFTSLLVSLILNSNPVQCFTINNKTMKLDKSKLSELRCNDIHFRVQIEIVWQNETKLFEVIIYI